MRISIELVPRSQHQLLADARCVVDRYRQVDTLNVPDTRRHELDSLTAVGLLHGIVPHRIPHLRARDVTPTTVARLVARLQSTGVTEVIVIAGDARDGADPPDAFEPVDLLRALARHAPWLTTYAALDPHRLSGAALARNVAAKREAGAKGFFSQPLYELRDLERCAGLVEDVPVFWGLSPVTSVRTQRYWETVNFVRFPPGFEPTLGWSHAFGRRAMAEVAARGHHLYLMPIKVDVATYLDGLPLVGDSRSSRSGDAMRARLIAAGRGVDSRADGAKDGRIGRPSMARQGDSRSSR